MQEVNRDSIKYLMEIANINPTKDKGQNFLVNPEICKNIIDLLKNNANSKVLEVGPGLGSLTYHLLNKCKNLDLIDVDERVINYLSLEVKDKANLIYKDALKYDVSKYEYIISNIPYNITTDLIEHLLLCGEKCKQYVFMCQKENFNHFNDTKGSEYGPLSVLIHLLGSIKKAFDVAAGNFVPAPKCVSTVFTIEINEDSDREEVIRTYSLARKAFANRRKTLLNNLSSIYGKDVSIAILEKVGINENARPEEISPSLYLKISEITKSI